MTDAYKLQTAKHYSVGGIKCPCCQPGISRQKVRRIARRTLKREDRKAFQEELS